MKKDGRRGRYKRVICITTTLFLKPLSTHSMAERLLWSGPLFGRLPKCGRAFLLHNGWIDTQQPDEGRQNSMLLQFIWPSKSGPQFETVPVLPALVRPYPTKVTDVLDDKVRLAPLLKGSQFAIREWDPCANNEREEGQLYFVKHRYGAQGKSVYVYEEDQLSECRNRASVHSDDFVVQHEVFPPALDGSGRKFVVRAHVLLYQRSSKILESFIHRDVICLPHATKYRCGNSNEHIPKSSHVSQAGKSHPPPILLGDLAVDHPAFNSFDQILTACSDLISRASTKLAVPIAPNVTCFALLGIDLLQSVNKEWKICEVNSHPALGWGSMSQVPKCVFEHLITDCLRILLEQQPVPSTSFVPLRNPPQI